MHWRDHVSLPDHPLPQLHPEIHQEPTKTLSRDQSQTNFFFFNVAHKLAASKHF